MKTLRDEAETMGGPLFSVRNGYGSHIAAWEAGFARGLGGYGDWRVVEGPLQYSTGNRIVVATGGGSIIVGETGDHVKLILPPEEKVLESEADKWHRKYAEGCAETRHALERADRYKQALREIATGEQRGFLENVARERRTIAKKALDE